MRDVSHDALRSQRLWRCGPAGALARSPARDQIKVLDLKIVKPLRSYSHAMIKAAHDFDRTTQKYDDVMKQHIIDLKMSRIHRTLQKNFLAALRWCSSGDPNNVNDNRNSRRRCFRWRLSASVLLPPSVPMPGAAASLSFQSVPLLQAWPIYCAAAPLNWRCALVRLCAQSPA